VILASTRLAEVLLALKVAFLVLLYLLIWRIVRTAARDLRTPLGFPCRHAGKSWHAHR